MRPRIEPGQVFGRLTVLNRGENAGRAVRWYCQCECAKRLLVRAQSLRTGNTKSCGCFKAEVTSKTYRIHGGSNSRAYSSWAHMIQRCKNPKNPRYPLYGGRGIVVCARWLVAENFLADMGEPPAGQTLDRIDVDGNYEPGNCRWATQKQQTRNTRRNRYVQYQGRRICLADLCDELSLSYSLVRDRLNRGWTVERAVGVEAQYGA